MNETAIHAMIEAAGGRCDARKLLSSYPALHDRDGLSPTGRVFASTFAYQISIGASGRQAEAAAKQAAGL